VTAASSLCGIRSCSWTAPTLKCRPS
jgi:hypothetical protein